MTRDQHEIRRKLRVLEYADKIGDVSRRIMPSIRKAMR